MTTSGQKPSEQGQCTCNQVVISKQAAFKAAGVWIHMKQECGKPLPRETIERLGLK